MSPCIDNIIKEVGLPSMRVKYKENSSCQNFSGVLLTLDLHHVSKPIANETSHSGPKSQKAGQKSKCHYFEKMFFTWGFSGSLISNMISVLM